LSIPVKIATENYSKAAADNNKSDDM